METKTDFSKRLSEKEYSELGDADIQELAKEPSRRNLGHILQIARNNPESAGTAIKVFARVQDNDAFDEDTKEDAIRFIKNTVKFYRGDNKHALLLLATASLLQQRDEKLAVDALYEIGVADHKAIPVVVVAMANFKTLKTYTQFRSEVVENMRTLGLKARSSAGISIEMLASLYQEGESNEECLSAIQGISNFYTGDIKLAGIQSILSLHTEQAVKMVAHWLRGEHLPRLLSGFIQAGVYKTEASVDLLASLGKYPECAEKVMHELAKVGTAQSAAHMAELIERHPENIKYSKFVVSSLVKLKHVFNENAIDDKEGKLDRSIALVATTASQPSVLIPSMAKASDEENAEMQDLFMDAADIVPHLLDKDMLQKVFSFAADAVELQNQFDQITGYASGAHQYVRLPEPVR